MSETFPKSKRIVSSRHFSRVLRGGGCAADDCLVVFALPIESGSDAEPAESRLGVTIPKKTGNAVVRNQWKRRIREAFRTQQDAIPAGYDFVVRPKKDAESSWEKIRRSMSKLPRKAVARLSKKK